MSLLTLLLATFVSEDLACVSAGLLVSSGQLDAGTAILGCFLGIFVGDLGLWLLGRLSSRRVLRWRFVERRLPNHRVEELARWFEKRGWRTVLAARFLPGARFPVYVGAGILGAKAVRFGAWAAMACFLWTPLLVGGVAMIGEPLAAPLQRLLRSGWIAFLATALLVVLLIRLGARLATPSGRAKLAASLARCWRWEFWPAWLFYLPLLPWIAYLAVRHRGLTTITAANPGIPHGGIVGESKFDILRRVPREWIVPTERIDNGPAASLVTNLRAVLERRGWSFPLILKPDVGERGAGVRLVRTFESAEAYVAANPAAMLVQTYHSGPFEAGVFYYRLPDEPSGRILSITDKRFPIVVGDGLTTVKDLIWRHPRFRMQADRFFARLNGQASHVLAPGERFRLAVAGNHCQGTEFRDGEHLITPALERRIDEIARCFDGFFFGRFDVRYSDPDAFRAGRDFAIVELNGASSESTNLYDPSISLASAYGILYRQWRILFEIGARNRELGHRVTPLRELTRVIRRYYSDRAVNLVSD